MSKSEVDLSLTYRFLYPRHVVLVSCAGKDGKANIITIAWSMPVSMNPPMVAISVTPQRHSYKLIEETQEFVINIPTMDILREVLFCGRVSGKEVDKFKESGLTSAPAKIVKCPIIKECVAHLECKLHSKIVTGDHVLFVGNVLSAYVNEGVFDTKFDLRKIKPVLHIGGDEFVTVLPKTITPSL